MYKHYKFRRVNKKDIFKISSLFYLIFNTKLTLSYYNWQYLYKSKYYSFVVLDLNNNIISHVGYSIKKFYLNDKIRKIAFRHTSMTDKSYRKIGLYSFLNKYAESQLKKDNIDLIICWPNKMNLPITKKQNNFNFLKKIKTFNISIKGNKNLTNQILCKIFNPINTLRNKDFKFNELNKKKCNYIYKDYKYIKKRYIEHPSNQYYFHISNNKELFNLIIFRFNNEKKIKINIVEYFSNDNNYSFLDNFIYLFTDYKCLMQIWHNNFFHIPKKYFLEKGFIPGEPIFNSGYFILNNRLKKINNINKYNYSMGDIDVF